MTTISAQKFNKMVNFASELKTEIDNLLQRSDLTKEQTNRLEEANISLRVIIKSEILSKNRKARLFESVQSSLFELGISTYCAEDVGDIRAVGLGMVGAIQNLPYPMIAWQTVSEEAF